MDPTDLQIIDHLTNNSRITMKELGEKVHLTAPATSARIEKLEDAGIIEGYTVKLNAQKLGYSVHAFVEIFTKSNNHQPYLNFIKGHSENVLNNYKISGASCYLLECQFKSNTDLNDFLVQLTEFVNYKLSTAIE